MQMLNSYDLEYIQMHLYENGLYVIVILSEVFWQLSSVFLTLGLHSLRLLQDRTPKTASVNKSH